MSITHRWTNGLLLLLLVVGCQSTTPAGGGGARAAVDEFLDAMNHADPDALARLFAEDATAYLPLNDVPQRIEGRGAIVGAIAPMFADLRRTSGGPRYMNLTAKNVLVQSLGEVAIVTFDAGSGPVTSRRTLVLRRTAQGWRVSHLHGSNIRLTTSPGT